MPEAFGDTIGAFGRSVVPLKWAVTSLAFE